MPLMTGTLPSDVASATKALEKDMLAAMQKTRDALAGGTADAACMRWFGDNSPKFKKYMKECVAKMRGVLNSKPIECKTTAMGGDATENASATHYKGGIFRGGDGNDRVDRMTDTVDTYINISPNFKSLPATAAGVPATWSDQDKLETLLHELSHYVFATRDEKMQDGSTAYGGAAARLLVQQNKNRAKANAENWGFFIEECGSL